MFSCVCISPPVFLSLFAKLSLVRRVALVLGNRLFVELGVEEPLQAPLLLLEPANSRVRSPELPSREVGLKEEDGVFEEFEIAFVRDELAPRELSKKSSFPPLFRLEE